MSERIWYRILSFLLGSVFRYRREVVEQNLQNVFHYPSGRLLNRAVLQFYRHFAAIVWQNIFTPSRKTLDRHVTMTLQPRLKDWMDQNKSVILVCGHVGNWEWGVYAMSRHYLGHMASLYKRIKNERVNSLMYRRRARYIPHLIESQEVTDLVRTIRQKPTIVLMIADQNPGSDQGLVWVDFFGRKTAFINGPESLARRYKLPLVYLRIDTPRPGHFHVSCPVLYDGISDVREGELTQRFATALEQNIRQYPVAWLWSHRRWKRTPPAEAVKDMAKG